ncbi:hypothetical protein SAMN05660330_00263 [Desulforhopalus singaporensis]|uniref:Uncharacterized protein n=1 Tax=Desulforhopalus singaporensis TaxID=91360 RepID=A0A1H0JP92_9BACT|nr:hypothetical protein SAMN05660330_00263 [Desulforhopalus singaporensis]
MEEPMNLPWAPEAIHLLQHHVFTVADPDLFPPSSRLTVLRISRADPFAPKASFWAVANDKDVPPGLTGAAVDAQGAGNLERRSAQVLLQPMNRPRLSQDKTHCRPISKRWGMELPGVDYIKT